MIPSRKLQPFKFAMVKNCSSYFTTCHAAYFSCIVTHYEFQHYISSFHTSQFIIHFKSSYLTIHHTFQVFIPHNSLCISRLHTSQSLVHNKLSYLIPYKLSYLTSVVLHSLALLERPQRHQRYKRYNDTAGLYAFYSKLVTPK